MSIRAIGLVLIFGASGAAGQTAAPAEFEVVSIKPSGPPTGRGRMVYCQGGPGTQDPGLFRCVNMSLSSFVTMAYNVNYFELSAPDWMTHTPFDVTARVPTGAVKEQIPDMLRSMLVQYFKLQVHHESRERDKYELVVAKSGARLNEAQPPSTPAGKAEAGLQNPQFTPLKKDENGYPIIPKDRPSMAIMNGWARMYEPAYTMDSLAQFLAAQLSTPVANSTGLTGKYEVSLFWMTENMARPGAPNDADLVAAPAEREPGPTLREALQQQLGLRLEPKKGVVDILVVDHAEKMPVEN